MILLRQLPALLTRASARDWVLRNRYPLRVHGSTYLVDYIFPYKTDRQWLG